MKNHRKKLIELLCEYGLTTSSWEDIWSYDGLEILTVKDAVDKIVELPTEFECDIEDGHLVIKAYKTKYLAHRTRYPASWTTELKFRYDQPADFEKMKEHLKFLKKNLKETKARCERWAVEQKKIQHMEEIETAQEGWIV